MDVSSDESDTTKLVLLLDSDDLNCGEYVLIKFCTIKNAPVYYVGIIQKKYDNNDFDIKCLRKNNDRYVYPLIDDISQVGRKDIVAKLPFPVMVKHTARTSAYYNFGINLDNYNMR